MIVNHSTLLRWQQIENEFKNGKEVPVYIVGTQEDAENLKETLDENESTFIIVDDVNEGSKVFQSPKMKTIRK